ncbi:TraB/GumN family protein [Octadecabacter sp.]|nr:TraB/GumN family protein [Octadecabacter sp.]
MTRFILSLYCLLLPAIASAQCQGDDITTWLPAADRTALQARVDATEFGQGLYWRATKDGNVINILGTMHLPDPRHAQILERTAAQLDSADIVLVEATLQDQTDMQIYMANNPDLLTINAGPTLPEMLDDATWQALRDAAQSRGIPGFMAAKMQPWFLALSLSIPPCAMGAMMSGELGLDAMIMERAAAQGIPVEPLEPWEDMFALLTSGTQDEQLDALRISALAPEVHDALLTTIVNAYFEGNMALGWHLSAFLHGFVSNVSRQDYAEQIALAEEQLLTDRNHKWIPIIQDAVTRHNDVFIAFGAAHLIGKDGVLNLLQQNGWTVAQH